jgi:hypothetical protein
MMRRLVVAAILTVWFFPPPVRAEGPRFDRQEQQSTANGGIPAPSGEPGTAAEAQRFAEREKQAQELQAFEGGRGGGIGTATLIIILLLVIILVLII